MGEKLLAAGQSLVQTSRRLRISSRAKSRRNTPQQCATPPPLGSGQREGNCSWPGHRGTQGRNGQPGKCAHCVKPHEDRSRHGTSRENSVGRLARFIRRRTRSASPSDAPGVRSAKGASNPRSSSAQPLKALAHAGQGGLENETESLRNRREQRNALCWGRIRAPSVAACCAAKERSCLFAAWLRSAQGQRHVCMRTGNGRNAAQQPHCLEAKKKTLFDWTVVEGSRGSRLPERAFLRGISVHSRT